MPELSAFAQLHKNLAFRRAAQYSAAESVKRIAPAEGSVVLQSAMQRIFRMRKGILTSSRLINARLVADKSQRWVPLMVTLTYRPGCDWAPDHISAFVDRVQQYAKRKGQKIPYAWVMELTKKGVPHYHCIFWIPRKWRLPRSDARGWWKFGSTNTVRARNPYGYLAKYASKGGNEFAEFPKGARICGIGGLTLDEAAIVAWWKLPKVLRLGDPGSHRWQRMPGGGWVCVEGDAAGKTYVGEWGLSSVNCAAHLVRLVRKPDVILPRVLPEDLVGQWRDAVYESGRRLAVAVCRRVEEDQACWNALASDAWGGAWALPVLLPSREQLVLEDQPAIDRLAPLPF